MMKSLIFLTTILVVETRGFLGSWDLIHFNRSENLLYECLENTNLWSALHAFDSTGVLQRFIIRRLSRRFNMSSVNFESINETSIELAVTARNMVDLSLNQTSRLRLDLANALVHCSDYKSEGALPRFANEDLELANLLDLILVDSEYLITQTDGLRALYSYAVNALMLLEDSRNRTGHSYGLFDRLRQMFLHRSELFFDHRSVVPYIRHAYSLDSSGPYTNDDPALFLTRRLVDFSERNPLIPSSQVSRIPSFRMSYGNYRRSMTTSSYYYEIRENRFFRTILFFLELVERGIVYLNDYHIENIPEDLMQILYNDTAYMRYLVFRYNTEIGNPDGQLLREGQIDEITLILVFWNRLLSTIIVPALVVSGETDSNDVSSTFEYEEHATQLPFKNDDKGSQNSGSNLEHPQEDENNEYYGYIENSGNQNQLDFPEELLLYLRELDVLPSVF